MRIADGKEMEFKDWYDKNSDPYGRAIFDYAIEWAEAMETSMDAGNRLSDVAMPCSMAAAKKHGPSGFMHGMAVSILASVWKYGEELRRWHNISTQIRDEGEQANKDGGVLNPALLTRRRR